MWQVRVIVCATGCMIVLVGVLSLISSFTSEHGSESKGMATTSVVSVIVGMLMVLMSMNSEAAGGGLF